MSSLVSDPEVLELVHEIFEEHIAFNRLLGLKVEAIGEDRAVMRFEMRDDLVGNYARRIMHGGVVSAAMDATAGLVAFLTVVTELEGATREQKLARFPRIGTIDMRVDFLRPGQGRWFEATAHVLRKGSRVAVIRTEMHDDAGELIASGTCTYMVG